MTLSGSLTRALHLQSQEVCLAQHVVVVVDLALGVALVEQSQQLRSRPRHGRFLSPTGGGTAVRCGYRTGGAATLLYALYEVDNKEHEQGHQSRPENERKHGGRYAQGAYLEGDLVGVLAREKIQDSRPVSRLHQLIVKAEHDGLLPASSAGFSVAAGSIRKDL